MNLSRRHFIHAGGTAALLASVGCDQVPKSLKSFLGPERASIDGPFRPPSSAEIDAVSHVLNRLTFGARPGDHQRVAALDADPAKAAALFIERQLAPEKIEDDFAAHSIRRCETLVEPMGELFEYKEKLLLDDLTRATLLRAVNSERQLFEVMVHFWSDHFNIDPSKGDAKWLKIADDRDVIRVHALGKFPELLAASAFSPAMLWYLDGRVNRRARESDKPNENYGRDLLELHTLGVHGGYSQKDVMEAARCLTGWTVRATERSRFEVGKVEFDPRLHDKGRKTVLGHEFPAWPVGLSADEQLQRGRTEVLRLLQLTADHPATALHLATKLCKHFIADEPPSGAVAAVADAFQKSSGDIRATLRALFATAEFRDTRGGKFKRPLHFIVSAVRATGAETDAGQPVVDFLLRMGHAPFRYPTPDGYPQEASPWMGTLLWRWNFAVALAEGRVRGTKINADKLRQAFGGDAGLMAHLLGRTPTAAETAAYYESGAGLALVLAAPSFQRC